MEVDKNPPVVLVPSLTNPVYNLPSYFFKIHVNIIFPAIPRCTLSTKHLTLACCPTNICGIHTDSVCRVFQKELYNFERLYKFIQRTYITFQTVIM
jgi:hypothetical protein